MDVYHVTEREKACKICAEGFRADAGSTYESEGTWLAEGWEAIRAMGFVDLGADAVIKVSIPEEILDPYERRPPKQGFREWCVPSDIVNEYKGTWEFYRVGLDELVAW